MLSFPPRFTYKGYRGINPLGTVPTFFDGDHMMTESSAICQYVAARYAPSFSLPVDDLSYAEYLNFLHMGEATLTFPQTIYFRYSVLEPPEKRQPAVAADYRIWFGSRLKNAASLFDGKQYVCGDRFTAADISFGYALGFATHLKLSDEFPPTIIDYWSRLKSREGFQRARKREIQASLEQGLEVPQVDY